MVQRALVAVAVTVHLGLAPARADIYLLDNARHHIGDGLFAPWSTDAHRLKLSTIGPKYAVAFCLTAPSRLKVVLASVMGIEQGRSEGDWLALHSVLAAGPSVPVVRSVTRPPNHEGDLRGQVLRYLERGARSRAGTRFIVPNEGSRGLAIRAYGAADGHVSVLPRSVDVGDQRPAFP